MDKLQAFATKMESSPELKAQVQAAKSVGEFVELMRSQGIEMTQAELMRSQAERILKFSDAELESAHIAAVWYSTDTVAGCVTWALTCTCSASGSC